MALDEYETMILVFSLLFVSALLCIGFVCYLEARKQGRNVDIGERSIPYSTARSAFSAGDGGRGHRGHGHHSSHRSRSSSIYSAGGNAAGAAVGPPPPKPSSFPVSGGLGGSKSYGGSYGGSRRMSNASNVNAPSAHRGSMSGQLRRPSLAPPPPWAQQPPPPRQTPLPPPTMPRRYPYQ